MADLRRCLLLIFALTVIGAPIIGVATMSPEKMPAEENYQGIVQEIGFKAGSDELCTVVFEDGRRIEFSTVNYVSAVKREKTQTFIRPGNNVVVTIEGKQYAETKFAVKKGEWVEVPELEGYRVMK